MISDIKQTSIYRFKHFNSPVAVSDNTGSLLLAGELDGIVIENFLDKDEINLLLKGFYSLGSDEIIKINKGFNSYPTSFAQFTQGLQSNNITEEQFHTWANQLRQGFSKKFGLDIESRLTGLFESVFTGKKVGVPVDRNNYGSFLPFNFRELLPEYGELKIHCENMFFDEFPLFFELMAHTVLRKNDFSFFIVLQKPETGGELVLYDKKWNENSTENFQEIGDTNNFVLKLTSNTLNTQLINPPAGSIVLFSGGDIWHKISTVNGNHSRVTLGGFVSSGTNEKEMFMWA